MHAVRAALVLLDPEQRVRADVKPVDEVTAVLWGVGLSDDVPYEYR